MRTAVLFPILGILGCAAPAALGKSKSATPQPPAKLSDTDAADERADYWEMAASTQAVQVQAKAQIDQLMAPIKARVEKRHGKYQLGPADRVDPLTGNIVRAAATPLAAQSPSERPPVPRTGFEKQLPSPSPGPIAAAAPPAAAKTLDDKARDVDAALCGPGRKRVGSGATGTCVPDVAQKKAK